MRWWRRYSGSRRHETGRGVERWHCTLYCLEFCTGFNDAKWQHLSTINTDGDLSFTMRKQQTYRRKQLMDQSDDNSLTALRTKKAQVRFSEIVNTCTERQEKRIQRTAWILSHVLRKTLCEHVNGLCPAGWLKEQSITMHWFQSVRTCPYSWATGRNIGNVPQWPFTMRMQGYKAFGITTCRLLSTFCSQTLDITRNSLKETALAKMRHKSHNDVTTKPIVRDKHNAMFFFHCYNIKVEFLPNKHA